VKKLDELRSAGMAPQVVLEHCVANGYQGLYAPRVNGTGGKQATLEAANRAAAEAWLSTDEDQHDPERQAEVH
jgi:hypothetical protein